MFVEATALYLTLIFSADFALVGHNFVLNVLAFIERTQTHSRGPSATLQATSGITL
jgi:hypothetical protein